MSSLSDRTTVVVAKDQVSCDLAGEAAILNLKNGVYYGLNTVGARVWNLVQEPKTFAELRDTPLIDKGFFVLSGNNQYVMQQLKNGQPQLLKAFLGWLLTATKGYAIKAVNPGGVEVWKSRGLGNCPSKWPCRSVETSTGVAGTSRRWSSAISSMTLSLQSPKRCSMTLSGAVGRCEPVQRAMRMVRQHQLLSATWR